MLVRCAVALSAGRNEGPPLPSRALSKAKIRSRINMTPIKTVVVGQEKKVEAVSLLRNASREWLGDWTSRKLQGKRKVIPSAKITESAKRCLQLQIALGLLGTTVLATGPGRSRSPEGRRPPRRSAAHLAHLPATTYTIQNTQQGRDWQIHRVLKVACISTAVARLRP